MIKKDVANIIDVFENFLDKKGINIDNDEKTGEEGEAIIYGSDYDELSNGIINTLKSSGIYIADTFEEDYCDSETEEIIVYEPSTKNIIIIGDGNITNEDMENGYEDSIYYDIYKQSYILLLLEAINKPIDTGKILYKENLRDKYNGLSETVKDVLHDIYNDSDNRSYIILNGKINKW